MRAKFSNKHTSNQPFPSSLFLYLGLVNKIDFFAASALLETDGSSTAVVKQFDSGSFGKIVFRVLASKKPAMVGYRGSMLRGDATRLSESK